MTTAVGTKSDTEFTPPFKVGDRVRFNNGPVMVVVDIYEHAWALCYWWIGQHLQEASFPVHLLIHALTFPGEEEVLAEEERPDWDTPVFSYKDLEALGIQITEISGDAVNNQ